MVGARPRDRRIRCWPALSHAPSWCCAVCVPIQQTLFPRLRLVQLAGEEKWLWRCPRLLSTQGGGPARHAYRVILPFLASDWPSATPEPAGRSTARPASSSTPSAATATGRTITTARCRPRSRRPRRSRRRRHRGRRRLRNRRRRPSRRHVPPACRVSCHSWSSSS